MVGTVGAGGLVEGDFAVACFFGTLSTDVVGETSVGVFDEGPLAAAVVAVVTVAPCGLALAFPQAE